MARLKTEEFEFYERLGIDGPLEKKQKDYWDQLNTQDGNWLLSQTEKDTIDNISGLLGFTLGPAQNVFTGADRAAAEAARDAYAVDPANATWLPQYNADTSLNIRLEFGSTAVYQVRNTAGDAWLDNSSATGVVGPQGPQGDPGTPGTDGQDGAGVSLPGIDQGVFVARGLGNTDLEATSMQEFTDRIRATKTIEVNDGSLQIGSFRASNSSAIVSFENLANNRFYLPVATRLDTQGTTDPIVIMMGAETQIQEQAVKTATRVVTPIDPLQFELTIAQDRFNRSVIVDTVGGVTNGNITIRFNSHSAAVPAYDYRRVTGGTGFNLAAGEQELDFIVNQLFLANETNYITLSTDSVNYTVRGVETTPGDPTTFVPFIALNTREVTFREGAHNGNVNTIIEALTGDDRVSMTALKDTSETVQDIMGATLVAGTNISINYDDTANTITINSTGATPAPSLSAFSIDIPSRVDLNTDLNNARTINYNVTNHSMFTALNLIVTVGDNKAVTLPVSDGLQSESITLSSLDTSSTTTFTFFLRGTYSGGTVDSNSQTVTVQNLAQSETAYYGVRPTNDFATVDLSNPAAVGLIAVDVTSSGTQFTTNTSVPNGQIFGILTPSNRDPVSILDPLSQNVLADFTSTTNVRTENGQQFNLLTELNNSGFQSLFNFTVTTE